MKTDYDVAIIGGGPAGSTVGSLLKKYRPDLKVAIFEKERFPRDHVGESLLPHMNGVLREIGVWDAIEACGFPVKLGARLRWGRTVEPFDFVFAGAERYGMVERPAQFEGVRRSTSFQVDRSLFDKILLDRAAELGCDVFEDVSVRGVATEGDTVLSIKVRKGEGPEQEVRATKFVDASGIAGVIRKAMNVEVDYPTRLRNIAIWNYWQDAKWATREGKDGTRIQILSLGWGWIWYITIGEKRTSVGLVVPADYYKATDLRPQEIYDRALSEEPRVAELLKGASVEGPVQSTKDWSFVADRIAGENWYLAGDSCGFADPILSAGMTLATTGARKVAYSLLSEFKGEHDPLWIRGEYDRSQRVNILNHVRFADFWYSSNALFSELQDYCADIARDNGLGLDSDSAFRWLASGGFTDDTHYASPAAGTYRIATVKSTLSRFTGEAAKWRLFETNRLYLRMEGAEFCEVANYFQGGVRKRGSFERDGKLLPCVHLYELAIQALQAETASDKVVQKILDAASKLYPTVPSDSLYLSIVEILESMIAEDWIEATVDPTIPLRLKATPATTLTR